MNSMLTRGISPSSRPGSRAGSLTRADPVRDASECRPSSAGAEIEWEHFRGARGFSVRLDAKQVTTGFQAGGVGIAVNVPVRAQLKARRGADRLRSPSLVSSNERHPVPG